MSINDAYENEDQGSEETQQLNQLIWPFDFTENNPQTMVNKPQTCISIVLQFKIWAEYEHHF